MLHTHPLILGEAPRQMFWSVGEEAHQFIEPTNFINEFFYNATNSSGRSYLFIELQ